MALKWIIGDFATGATTESSIIPVISDGQKVSVDINGGDQALINMSFSDLPSDWRTYLKPLVKFVALIDDSRSWTDGVIWGGFIRKNSAKVKGVVRTQAVGMREYLSLRQISDIYNSSSTSATAGITFQAADWQGVMNEAITHCFSTAGIPGGSPLPPQVLGNVSGSAAGTTISKKVLYSDFTFYQDLLDEIRDEASPGNEYYFKARWKDATKTAVVWDAIIGTDAAPHIGEATTTNITIADNSWQPTSLEESFDAAQVASRIVGQSKNDGTTIDYTTKTDTTFTNILIDQAFNPGVELTGAEMTAQLTSRIGYAQAPSKDVSFERVYTDVSDLVSNLGKLGNLIAITGTEEATNFNVTMRLVGIDFSFSNQKVNLSLMQQAARYPKLPKDRNPFVPSLPVFPPSPPISGTTLPPFTPPTFGESSPLTLIGGKYIIGANSTSNNWQYQAPVLSTMRQQGKFIYALSAKGNATSTPTATVTGGVGVTPTLQDLVVRVWDVDANAAFTTGYTAAEPFAASFAHTSSTSSQTITAATLNANRYTTADTDIVITGGQYVDNPAFGGANEFRDSYMRQLGAVTAVDFDLIVGEDDVLVRALYSLSNCVWPTTGGQDTVVGNGTKPETKWKIKEVVYRATRDRTTGAIGVFSAMATNPFEQSSYIFWSAGNTWIYNGRIYCLGGYAFKKDFLVSGLQVTEFLPHYANKYYNHNLYSINIDGTSLDIKTNFLPLSSPGPVAPTSTWDVPRLHHLSSRAKGAEVVVGYSNGVTNTREYFYSTFLSLNFSKVMNTTGGPATDMAWGKQRFNEPDSGVAPVIVGSSVLLIEPSGLEDIVSPGTVTPMSYTGRALYTSRCKIGFTDTVFSNLPFPDAISVARPLKYAPIAGSTLSSHHFTGNLFGIRGSFPMRSLDSVSDSYEYQLTTGRTTNSSAGAYGATGYFINRIFLRQSNAAWTDILYSAVTKGVPRAYSTANVSSSMQPVSDYFYFENAGKVYVLLQSAITYYTSQTGINDPNAILMAFNLNTTGW